jgi:chromosome segregation ATPase
MRRQLSDFKNKMVSAENEWEKEKEELCEINDQLRTQIKLLRRDQSEKENELYEVKEILRRCDSKNQTLEETVTSLKTNLKKTKSSMDSELRQITSLSEEERGKLEMMVQEFKVELERQMDEKGALALEVKRLRGVVDRRDQQEKQRKLLLMNEFREIDKLEKVVKRII